MRAAPTAEESIRWEVPLYGNSRSRRISNENPNFEMTSRLIPLERSPSRACPDTIAGWPTSWRLARKPVVDNPALHCHRRLDTGWCTSPLAEGCRTSQRLSARSP